MCECKVWKICLCHNIASAKRWTLECCFSQHISYAMNLDSAFRGTTWDLRKREEIKAIKEKNVGNVFFYVNSSMNAITGTQNSTVIYMSIISIVIQCECDLKMLYNKSLKQTNKSQKYKQTETKENNKTTTHKLCCMPKVNLSWVF